MEQKSFKSRRYAITDGFLFYKIGQDNVIKVETPNEKGMPSKFIWYHTKSKAERHVPLIESRRGISLYAKEFAIRTGRNQMPVLDENDFPVKYVPDIQLKKETT